MRSMIKFSGKALFTMVLLAFVGLMLYLTLGLSRVARLVPLIVIVPTLLLLLFQSLVDLIPRLAQKYERFEKADLFGVTELIGKAQTQLHPSKEVETRLPSRRRLSIFLWILMLLIFIYLFGYLIAAPLYTFLYLKERAAGSWLLSTAMAAGMGSLLYGVFVLALRTRLYEGQLWVWLSL